MLKTNRSMWKFILLSLVTCGIYGLVVLYEVSNEINLVASERDGKNTVNYLWVAFILGPITLGIYTLIWWHKLSNRLGDEESALGITVDVTAKDFWLWCILGSLIVVGPFVYYSKFFKAANRINEDYNSKHPAA